MNVDWEAGLIFYIVSIPWFIACFIYTKWLILDSKENREALPMAVWLCFATVVVGSIVQFGASFFEGEMHCKLNKAHNAVKNTRVETVSGHKKVPKVD